MRDLQFLWQLKLRGNVRQIWSPRFGSFPNWHFLPLGNRKNWKLSQSLMTENKCQSSSKSNHLSHFCPTTHRCPILAGLMISRKWLIQISNIFTLLTLSAFGHRNNLTFLTIWNFYMIYETSHFPTW